MVISFKWSIFQAFKFYDEGIAAFNEFQEEIADCEEPSSSLFVDESRVGVDGNNGANVISPVMLARMFVRKEISELVNFIIN